MLKGRNIVVGITGGIAAYKTAMLVRLLVKAGAEVQVIMTPSAKEFITPVTLSTLSGRPVISEFFTANTGQWNSHVSLGLWADAMVIAPATACTLAKMATGVADNMLVTSYLSCRATTFVAPAMDLDMWRHPTTGRNLEELKRDGVKVIEPTSGELASHLTGKGRMAEPEAILAELDRHFAREGQLAGKKIVITAGPTYENIDPVRFIGNHSSGRMGYSLAEECASRGAEVTLVSGPVSIAAPASEKVKTVRVTSALEMLSATEVAFKESDAAIFCAAVADFRPSRVEESKIKRGGMESMEIKLVANPDIAATLSAVKEGRTTVGFALETDSEEENAMTKLRKKNLDWVVLNSLNDPDAGFAKSTNKVTIFGADGSRHPFEAKDKRQVAADIIDTVFGKG